MVDVANGDTSRAAAARSKRSVDPKGDVAGPARDVDEFLTSLRIKPLHHRVFPEAMHTTAHEIVHEVVAVRHRREDLVNQAFLRPFRDSAIAECGLGHQKT